MGILNGIETDVWDPSDDPHLPITYDVSTASRKRQIGRALATEVGWEESGDPIIGMVTRLTYQKGLDLVKEMLPGLLDRREFSLAVLGNGEDDYENFFHWLHSQYPGRVSFYQGFNNPLAHRIEAGSDIFLMPSRYEPCGLNQMYSLRYGTIPLVRKVGGLADSVDRIPASDSRSGTGFVFEEYDVEALLAELRRAVDLFGRPTEWTDLVRRAMAVDNSWDRAAGQYLALFEQLASD